MATVIGCGNSCFVGFSNNGNGVVIVKAGNPPPPCSLPQPTGLMSFLAVKSSVCESCPAPHPQHIFVTLQGIQLHSSPVAGPTSPDWHEIAPRLADEPLLIDLIGGSLPRVFVAHPPAPPRPPAPRAHFAAGAFCVPPRYKLPPGPPPPPPGRRPPPQLRRPGRRSC